MKDVIYFMMIAIKAAKTKVGDFYFGISGIA